MPHDNLSIGPRLRQLRTERGLTQEALAEAAGLSVDLVKKLEQGARSSARLATLIALANALDVSLSELTAKRPHLNGDPGPLVIALRDAVLAPGQLPGLDEVTGEAVRVPILEGEIATAWRMYWGGRFAELAHTVPGLIAQAQATHRDAGLAAAGALTQSYELAACLLVQLGRDEIAATAAEKAIATANAGDDELQWATVCGIYAWALMSQGRMGEAERLAQTVAQRIEPRLSTATPAHLTVWGGTLLWALAAAAAAGRADAVPEYLALAKAGAARLPGERSDYEMNFGPTQVSVQAVHAWAVLGEPDKALTVAATVDGADLRPISYGRYLIDVAQAQTDAHHDGSAVATLHQAADLAPVWFRNQGSARTLTGQIRQRHPRGSAALRELVGRLGPAEGHNTSHI